MKSKAEQGQVLRAPGSRTPAHAAKHGAGRAGQEGWEGGTRSLLEQTQVAATACSSGASLSLNFALANYVGNYFTAVWGMASRIPFTERR